LRVLRGDAMASRDVLIALKSLSRCCLLARLIISPAYKKIPPVPLLAGLRGSHQTPRTALDPRRYAK
jgi:hypothetical protein